MTSGLKSIITVRLILLDGKCPIADIASFEYDIRYNSTISGSAIASLYQGETDNPAA